MMTETGRVIGLSGKKAWIQTIRTSACESCSARHGCGQKVLATASSGRANQVLVDNHLGAIVGDEVTVSIEESALLAASVLVYAVPLLLMVGGALLGQQWLPGPDAGAISGAVLGLAGGFGLVRWMQSRSARRYEPELVGILRPQSSSAR